LGNEDLGDLAAIEPKQYCECERAEVSSGDSEA
jgi:hypothetical protein